MKVIVVGGGIAGMSAGWRLHRAGYQVRVLDAASYVGGRMATIEHRGFRLDVGASGMSTKYTQMVELANDVGIGSHFRCTSDVMGFVRDGTVHRMRSTSRLDPLRTRLLSTRAKLVAPKLLIDTRRVGDRLDWYDLSRAADFGDETIAHYGRRRLSRSWSNTWPNP